jgi:ABC-type phosphate transport system substrate-binding protein
MRSNRCRCIEVLVIGFIVAGATFSVAQFDDYAIVANKQLEGNTIPKDALKGIYLREVKNWGNGQGAIIPVDLSSARNFYMSLFGKSYVQMQAYWLSMRVKYSVELPVSKNDAESVKKFIAENKGAIGFLKNSDVDERVKILKIVN